jgi:hypothetical protein
VRREPNQEEKSSRLASLRSLRMSASARPKVRSNLLVVVAGTLATTAKEGYVPAGWTNSAANCCYALRKELSASYQTRLVQL